MQVSNRMAQNGYGYCAIINGDGIPRCPSVSYEGTRKQVRRQFGKIPRDNFQIQRITISMGTRWAVTGC